MKVQECVVGAWGRSCVERWHPTRMVVAYIFVRVLEEVVRDLVETVGSRDNVTLLE